MKTALLIGCGGTRGENIIKGCQQANFKVINVGSSESKLENVENFIIDWKTFHIPQLHKLCKQINQNIDFIFFNQNSSALSKENFTDTIKTFDLWNLTANWSKSYWLSCQFPFTIIKTLEERNKLDKNATIGWMLSSYIDKNVKGVDDYADYSGYKFTNYLVMKNFNTKYQCFGINPQFGSSNYIDLIYKICSDQIKCNGDVF
tara:strand:- start:351 stop:959 length:609 start_codon:yes stop_codon:yes gene_type:complete